MAIRFLFTLLICLFLAGCSALGLPTQTRYIVITATAPSAGAQPTQPAAAQNPAPTNTAPAAAAQNPAPTNPAPANALPTPTSAAAAVVPATGAQVQVSFDQLMDFKVADASGNLLGEVKDAVIDRTAANNGQGSVSYLVVESNLTNDWYIPVPWKYVQVRPDSQVVVLPVNANQLAAAPGFNKDTWPGDFSGQNSAVQNFWANPGQAAGAAPALPMGAAANYLRAKDVMSLKILNQQGVELGEIKDLAIDWANSQPGVAQSAQFRYVVMELNNDLGFDNHMIPVPWRLVQINPGQESVVVNMAQNMATTAPNFLKGSLPNLYADPWSSQLSQFWH